MRILLVHNRYQNPGGEDAVFEAERTLLISKGHSVAVYERHNDEISHYSAREKTSLLWRTTWAHDSATAIRKIIDDKAPEIVHFYNTFPLVSPAAYYSCAAAGVPVIQTVPNYRLVCPGATLERGGRTCELCISKLVPLPAVRYGCYRGSRLQSAVASSMLMFHRMLGTWESRVDTYFALTDFARRKLIEGGLPANRIVVKPNFIHPDPGSHEGDGKYALFVGRLSAEKGVDTLLEAWKTLDPIPLKVAGDGPMMASVRSARAGPDPPKIEILGWCSKGRVLSLMRRASFLVFPSRWYEGFPLTILEAFACGTPVVGSRLGSISEIVREDVSGLLFEPGDAISLEATVRRVWEDRALRSRLGRGARHQFESLYTADANYRLMMKAFTAAVARRPSA